MVSVKKEGVVLEKTNRDFENEGVLNPAVIQDGDTIHLFYRAVREGNNSTIGYCTLNTPLTVATRSEEPILAPEFEFESKGLEDPRIVKIDDLYYLTYTAYDGVNALGALAVSYDLKTFTKKGIIVAKITYGEFSRLAESDGHMNNKYVRFNEHWNLRERLGKKILLWDKNVMFFPRRIKGKLFFIHRVRPDIQITSVNELEDLTQSFWQYYFLNLHKHILLSGKHDHEISYVGGGCPPIETEAGWLLIYHGVRDTANGYVYSACAALLDLEDPTQEISRLPYALFQPDRDWELTGYVNNVCFPSGTALINDTLYIYYGAADEQIACASLSLSELLKALLRNTKKDEILNYVHQN